MNRAELARFRVDVRADRTPLDLPAHDIACDSPADARDVRNSAFGVAVGDVVEMR
ncbi:hypothetical protein [Nocardia tenerifensis]|uniref:hypothetical protein n=1 Tax=Nocardia tenerifensis TaxID=228006 RepID=UPI00030C9179|nr:hypothetical protein [Nocardia tenerifensis]